MKGLQIRQVKLSFAFKKDVTIKKTVDLFVNDIRDAITIIPCGNTEALEEARLEVIEILAIIQNKQSRHRGLDLMKVQK